MRIVKYLKSNAKTFVLISYLLTLSACQVETINQPESSDIIPKQVSNVQVKSLSGAAVITYDIVDDNTDYVLVKYETSPGVMREQKASKFLDSLLIDGFPIEGNYPFKLYSVHISENRSEPVEMTAKVLETPLAKAFKTLNIKRDFGGVAISAINAGKGDLIIETITIDDNLQVPKTADLKYTLQDTIRYSLRGYPSESRLFWFTMRDRWGHRSDTLKVDVTPFFEEEIPQNTINPNIVLPTDYDYDYKFAGWAGGTKNLFDGNTNTILGGLEGPGLKHVTFEFGKEIILSRFKIWQRQTNSPDYYNGPSPKIFELWGSNAPSEDGSFDSWLRIGRYEIKKPSGKPKGENSNEDVEELRAGHEFMVPIEYGKMRYVRLVMIENWNGGSKLMVAELKFWGNRE